MKIPKILTNSVFYSISSFLHMGIGFLLLPVYTYYLTPEDYGKLNVITTIAAFFSQISLMSLHTAASRLHFKSDLKEYRAKVWGSLLLLVICNSVFWGIITISFHHYLITPFAKGISFYPLLFLAIIGTVFSPIYNFYQQWLRNLQNGLRYALNSIVYFIMTVILNLIGLIIFHIGILGLVLSSFLVSIIFFAYSLRMFIPHIDLKYNKEIGKEAVKYALPLIPHSVTGYWSSSIDKILLNHIQGASAVGIYSIAGQFGSVINAVTTSINMAYSPWFYQIVTGDDKKSFSKLYVFADFSILFFCFVALLISLFSPEVISLMAPKSYMMAWMPVSFVCFSGVARGLYYFFSQPLFYAHTKYVMYVSFTSLMANVMSNLIFIPILGAVGAGISIFVSMLTIAVFALIFSIHLEPNIKYHHYRMLSMCIFFLILSQSVFIFQMVDDVVSRLFFKLIFFIVTLFIFIYPNRRSMKLVLYVFLLHKMPHGRD